MSKTRTRGAFRNIGLAALMVGLLCGLLAPLPAQAGKEGIYLSDNVYFTLEKVRFSEGSDDSILRFAVMLHNGGGTTVDYNYYGARVTDADGFGYSAQLTGTQTARVLPGAEKEFAYEARVAKGLRPEQLRVTMFGWSFAAAPSMNDIASFSVANALEESAGEAQEASVPVARADATLASDARLAVGVGSEYAVYENGRWSVYAELIATNRSDSGFAWPTGLKMRLENAQGQQMAATAVEGADKSLLPGKPTRITVRAEMPDGGEAQGWTLQFYYMNGETATVLDSLDLSGVSAAASIGDSRPVTDSGGAETVSLRVVSAVVSQSGDGQWVRAQMAATNNGSGVMETPGLSGKFQSAAGGITVEASDAETHDAYLSPGETESYSFSGLLPKGMTANELQLVLFEKRGGSSGTSSGSAAGGTGTGTSAGAGTSSGASSDNAGAGSSGTAVPVLVASLAQAELVDQGAGAEYTAGDSIDLPLDHRFDVAVTELKLYDNENYGFKTAVAKLKIGNTDNAAYALPGLALDIADENGRIYTGTRQTNVISELATNSSYLVTYSFIMPEAEAGQPVTLRLYNGTDSILLGAVKLALEQDNTADDVWDTYPYRITVNEADLLLGGQLSATFTYTLKLNVGLERSGQVIEDASVSKLQFEIEDASGLVLSAQTIPFQGATKLLNGDNTISFTNLKLNQYNSTNYVNVYEVIDTPNGTVKRKLGEIR
ncbi:hypothetical protein [Paenibacillus sp. GYB003]|uniref:hypothetical protein n=1 Tax=Paenibacillus sp. GYB003 TaxID=2994392 RepID=UPI002F969F1E